MVKVMFVVIFLILGCKYSGFLLSNFALGIETKTLLGNAFSACCEAIKKIKTMS
jgi:predicted RND superfamily exporter protein